MDINNTNIEYKIKEILENKIAPAIRMDGGDIKYENFNHETGILEISLHGACIGCPFAQQTLQHGVENTLKYYIPEVVSVVLV